VFSVGSVQRLYLENRKKASQPESSLEKFRSSLQADQSESEDIARQPPLVEAWEAENPSLL
jgi:hypothetical protein